LQHAFATTVETVTTFTGTPLKSGAGPIEWRRFFSLMGSAIAVREGTPLVEGTPSEPAELVRELREAATTLRVHDRLNAWTNAIRSSRARIEKYKWLLLVLDTTRRVVTVTGYRSREEASKRVAEIEQSKSSNLDAVLVWVDKVKELPKAYPNYYADTREFLKVLDVALAEN
jgi:putative GTP pyrophosphokinase